MRKYANMKIKDGVPNYSDKGNWFCIIESFGSHWQEGKAYVMHAPDIKKSIFENFHAHSSMMKGEKSNLDEKGR